MGRKTIETLSVELRGSVTALKGDMANAIGTMKGAEARIAGIANGIGNAIKAGFAIGAVIKLAGAVGELAHKGEAAGSLADAFKKLGGNASQIDAASRATLGMVSSFDLMQIANRGLLAQLPTVNQNFGKIADIAARSADALNIDTKTAIEQLTEALIKGKKNGLEKFGFELSGIKGKADIQAAAIGQFNTVLGKLAPVSDSVANAQDALGVVWDDLIANIGIQLNNNPQLIEGFRNLGETIKTVDFAQIVSGMTTFIEIVIESGKIIWQFGSGLVDVLSSAFQKEIDFVNGTLDLFGKLPKLYEDTYNAAYEWLVAKFEGITSGVKEAVTSIETYWKNLYDKLVGHSVIPDMVDLTTEEFRRMHVNTVTQTKGMTSEISDAMADMTERYHQEIGSIDELLQAGYNKSLDDANKKTTSFTEGALDGFGSLSRGLSGIFGDAGGIFSTFDKFLGIIDSVSSAIQGIDTIGQALGYGSFINQGTAGGAKPGGIPSVGGIGGGSNPATGALGGAATGAGIGANFGPQGAAIGAGIGAVIGGIGSLFADGGVISQPTLLSSTGGSGLMGEAGPEAIMPLTRKGGRLGVSVQGGGGGKVYNIDARGASPGVSGEIIRALKMTEERAVARSINAISDSRRRGGAFRT